MDRVAIEDLVDRVQRDAPGSVDQLYDYFNRSVRRLFLRQLPKEDVEDILHESYMAALTAIRNGRLTHRAALPSFIRTICRRKTYTVLWRKRTVELSHPVAHEDVPSPDMNAEDAILRNERQRIARTILAQMSDRDRAVIRGFYLERRSKEALCQEWQIAPERFRLILSRARQRFHSRLAARDQGDDRA